MIDNIAQNFRLQNENGILIKSFYTEDSGDKELLNIIPLLKSKLTANV
jgi:hypothetical protein